MQTNELEMQVTWMNSDPKTQDEVKEFRLCKADGKWQNSVNKMQDKLVNSDCKTQGKLDKTKLSYSIISCDNN